MSPFSTSYHLSITCDFLSPYHPVVEEQLTLSYEIRETSFGKWLIVEDGEGICQAAFVRDEAEARQLLQESWLNAQVTPEKSMRLPASVFQPHSNLKEPITLRFYGTSFQHEVWETLLYLPFGQLATYSQLAQQMGKGEGTVRAVGTAVGQNPLAWLVPCHRIIRKDRELGGYRWGLPLKKRLLSYESGAEQLGFGW